MHAIDPLAGKIGERHQVLLDGEHVCLEAAHLARRCSTSRRSFAADDPAHRRIMAQAFGIIHIFIAGKSPED